MGKGSTAPARGAKTPQIAVGSTLDDPHPYVALTRKCFEKSRPSTEDWLIRPEQVRRLDLCVSEAQLLRALIILDALLKALDGLKIPVMMARGEKCRTFARCDGAEVEIRLKEMCVGRPAVLTAAQEREKQTR